MDPSGQGMVNSNRAPEAAHLQAGALSFTSVLMQAISHIAPAVGLVLSLQFITAAAGVASPLAYAIAFGIVLTLGVSLTQLARVFPSAGGYYTYVSRTVHPRAGFLTAWVYFLYDPPAAAVNLAIMSYFLERTFQSEYHLHLPWWIPFVTLTVLLCWVQFRGITISVRAMVVVAIGEIAIIVALAVAALFHAGSGGINFSSFAPYRAPSLHGLYLGIMFCIFTFSGFESVAPLAEESRDPRRNLPRGIIWSIVLTGVFFLLGSWAILIGWGTESVQSFVQSTESPLFVLARRLWGGAWILVPLAVINSTIACAIACSNAATRVFFAMGRVGVLPRWLSKIHPQHKTPVNAIWLETLVTLSLGLGLGFWLGPDQEFYFMGIAMTLGMIMVYAAGNIGVFRWYRYRRPKEFQWLLHGVFPFLSTAALLAVAYNCVFPLPPGRLRYAPWLVGGWLLGGGLLVWIFGRADLERRFLDAGQLVYGLVGDQQAENEGAGVS